MRDNNSFTEVFSKISDFPFKFPKYKLCDWSTFSSEEASGSGLSCGMVTIQNVLTKFGGPASLEDNDDNVVVFADEDINRKLEEALNPC
ncbi:10038_t:CDS:2 [Rhizophagus irregularis]|nr:10038_t:CDS:2 [Rhizophagus irregularis]